MCIWMVGVLYVLMCLGNHQAQAANTAISMPDRVRVTLAGETLHFILKVTIPMNQNSSDLVCSGPPDQKEIQRWPLPFSQTTKDPLTLTITARNSSYSGEYNCKYKNAEIFWTLLVKDEGYRQPYSDFIVLGALTTGLLIFSVIGSIYVFKSQWGQFTLKNGSTGSGVSRRNRGENEEEEDSKINAAASASVYASLESRPASVYEVLAPGAAAAVNRESVQRKEKVKRKKSKESMEDATPQGDVIFECVYENF
ncbi:hypothetical protein J4Q44_G00287290 [Coregonus suidteri]|uniref:Uncharacterized protein n=1 Tax=Coregonus suidteri TaxID=861788 RepID=A0AAN8LG65_9TELE